MSATASRHRRINYTLLPSGPSRAVEGEPVMEETKTPVELKTALINRALEETGMGKYQWCIFFLCGFGYALDLMWAQAFSLVTPRIQQELGVAVFSAGLTVGAFVWGLLVDIIGRRWAFNLTVGIVAAFGLVLGGLDSWSSICGIVFFVGFGLGGNIPIDATIVLEFLPNDRRYLLAALSVFQPVGVIITSLLSWALIPRFACQTDLPACSHVANPSSATCCTKADNYGWRYALFTIGGLSVAAFFARFVLFTFHESPKFLVTRGHDRRAVEVVEAVARFNGRQCTLSTRDLEECDKAESDADGEGEPEKKTRKARVGHLGMLFSSWSMIRLTLLTWVCYAADYWGFTIAGNFLPKFLADRGAAANDIVIAVVGVPGVLLGAALIEIPRFGRKWSMVLSSALMGVSLFLYATITTPAATVGFNAMEYFFQSTFNAVLYGWTPEAFPAAVRGSACGLASFWGRLSSIVAPLIAAHLGSSNGVLYLAGGGVLLCTLCALFLPDTKDTEVM
ncbi:hypothetical protein EIP86_006456 [Pleurotus ostreatoroseus]|nr:hypothetical protein EIP86_006456 [Pleurotus ostreatoroseus]